MFTNRLFLFIISKFPTSPSVHFDPASPPLIWFYLMFQPPSLLGPPPIYSTPKSTTFQKRGKLSQSNKKKVEGNQFSLAIKSISCIHFSIRIFSKYYMKGSSFIAWGIGIGIHLILLFHWYILGLIYLS